MYPAAVLNKFIITNATDEYLEQLDWNNKLAVVSSLKRAQYFRLQHRFDIYSFTYPNQIYEYTLKFLMRPNFPFANDLNRFIQQATEGGLINKWINNYRWHLKVADQNEIVYIKFQNWALFLGILLIVWLFLISLFMLERTVHKKVRTIGSRRFWKYIEMMIDPVRRCFLNKYARSVPENPRHRRASLGTVLRFHKCRAKDKKRVLARSFKNKPQANSHITLCARRTKKV